MHARSFINPANTLTLLRAVLVLAMYPIAWRGDLLLFAVLFPLAGATDAVDGWLARRFHMESEFGEPVRFRRRLRLLLFRPALVLVARSGRRPFLVAVDRRPGRSVPRGRDREDRPRAWGRRSPSLFQQGGGSRPGCLPDLGPLGQSAGRGIPRGLDHPYRLGGRGTGRVPSPRSPSPGRGIALSHSPRAEKNCGESVNRKTFPSPLTGRVGWGCGRLRPPVSSIINRVTIFFEAIKFSHTIFALPFALTGMVLAANGWPSALTVLWIAVAMVGARTGAMGMNRVLDAAYDARNPRTSERAIPKGSLSRGFVTAVSVLSFGLLVLAASQLNALCLYLSPIAIGIVVAYSLTKRFTSLSHIVLGLSLSLAPVGAWIAVRGEVSAVPLLLGGAVLLWVAGFDIPLRSPGHRVRPRGRGFIRSPRVWDPEHPCGSLDSCTPGRSFSLAPRARRRPGLALRGGCHRRRGPPSV